MPQKPPRVRVVVGASFELLAAIWAFLDEENHPVYEASSDWLRRAERRMGAEATQLRRFAGGSLQFWDHVLGLAMEAGPPYDLDGLLAHVERTDPHELRLHLLGRYNAHVLRTTTPERIEAAAAGDSAARRAFRREVMPDKDAWQQALRKLFRSDPEHLRGELLHVLRLWHERAFAPELPVLTPILEREATVTRKLAMRHDAADVLDRATDGLRWALDADLSDVLLAPSFVARPIVYYVQHRDVTLVMHPVSEESVQGGEIGPPARLVTLAKALADEGRLKVLHAVRGREMTTAEVAERLGVPRTTMWHHVMILRGAGLIRTVRTSGNQTAIQLREEALPEVGDLLDSFLAGEPAARLARRPAARR